MSYALMRVILHKSPITLLTLFRLLNIKPILLPVKKTYYFFFFINNKINKI